MRFVPALVVLAVAACGKPPVTESNSGRGVEPPSILPGGAGSEYRISGPFVHENLAVYVVHSDKQDARDFITLDEGLKDGSVTVTEKEQEQVNELLLENNNSKPLFVQEGDRVKGGKQDRIVGLSFVVPAKSGKRPIPSFCVEQGRWTSQGGLEGASFGAGDRQLAPKEVRAAAKADKDQGGVWQEVGGMKRKAQTALGAENTNTSLNETMDSEKTKKALEPYLKALDGLLAGKTDSVGVAFALNGKIEEVNIYPGSNLLAKLYPRLLGSYALSAVIEKKEGKAPTATEVLAFMKESREKSKRTEQVAENSVTIRNLEANVNCLTEYEGKVVHTQWMRRDEASRPAAGNEGQQRLQQEEQNAPPRQR